MGSQPYLTTIFPLGRVIGKAFKSILNLFIRTECGFIGLYEIQESEFVWPTISSQGRLGQ
jgi:hypothetical protein